MGVTLLAFAAVAAALVLRILLELRLRDHHPEVRKTLVTKPYGGNLLVSHLDNRLLMGFLVRRAHRSMNDRPLSLMADAMLFIAGVFMLVMIGALVALGSILLQGGGAAQ